MTWPVYMEREQTLYGVPLMTKKKTPAPEHVTLTKATVEKLLSQPEAPAEARMLSPWDILALERAEHAAARAEALLMQKKADETTRKFAMELATIKMDGEMRMAMEGARAAMDAHRKLADAIAKDYGFSWTTHSYNPETGEVLESGPEA